MTEQLLAAAIQDAKEAEAYASELEVQIKALVKALEVCRDELDAYSQQEYPSDHPVHERYRQRDYDANPARAALAATKEPA